MIRRLVILSAVMALGAAIFAPASQANLAITKWQSLTCKENKDLPATPPYAVPEVGYETTLPPPTEQCTSATEAQMVHPGGRPSQLRDHRLQAGDGPASPDRSGRLPARVHQRDRRQHAGRPQRQPGGRAAVHHRAAGAQQMPGLHAGRDQLPDRRGAVAERRRQMPAGRRMPAGARRAEGLQPGSLRRPPVDGRVPDRRRPDLHRRLARPGRPARHLHDRGPRSVADQPADHRVAAGLQRAWPETAPT